MIRFGDMFMIVLTAYFFLVPLIAYGIFTDKIEINFNNDFLDEYNSCQEELERTQPICPACECVAQKNNLTFWNFVGIIEGIILMFFLFSYKDKIFKWLNKRTADKRRKAK